MVDPMKAVTGTPTAIHAEAHTNWVDVARQGILTEDISIADRSRPPLVTGIVDETGQEMTFERRQQLAAQAKTREYQLGDTHHQVKDYEDVPMGKREPWGASAVNLRPKGLKVFTGRPPPDPEAVRGEAESAENAANVERLMNKER